MTIDRLLSNKPVKLMVRGRSPARPLATDRFATLREPAVEARG